MTEMDRLLYFDAKGLGEGIRQLYILSGTEFFDEKIDLEEFKKRKTDLLGGKLPVLYTADGCLNQSTVIARYVARKVGRMGKTDWDAAQNDLVVTNVQEIMDAVRAIYRYTIFKDHYKVPRPEDAEEGEAKIKQNYIDCLNKIEKLAASTPGKFILGDEIQLADCWLHACLEFTGVAFSDSKSLTNWTCEFVKSYETDPCIAKYFKERKPSLVPV